MFARFQFSGLIRAAALLLALVAAPGWAASAYDGWGVQHVPGVQPANSTFGSRVAVDGDFAAVGAQYWVNEELFSFGRVDMYVFRDGIWEHDGTLVPDDGHQNLRFGAAVALSGDVAVIGAVGAIVNGMANHGAAYVFRRVDGTWVQEAKLAADETTNADNFGNAVAVSGSRVLVSADTRPVGGQSNAGAVYAFALTANGWEQEARLEAADPVGAARFGNAIAMDGDHAVIGSNFAVVDGITNGGAAYVFAHDGAGWTEVERLVPADHAAHQQFGHSVGIAGQRVIVGAPRAAIDGIAFTGAAYVFEEDSGSWTEVARLVAGDAGSNESYGESVSAHGEQLLVGAMRATIEGVAQVGAGYLYERDGANWEQIAKLGPLEPESGEYSNFGESVSLAADRIVIGQPNLQDETGMVGAVSLFAPVEAMAFRVTPTVVAGLGTTDPDSAQIVPYGDSVSFELLPDAGYHVTDVDSDCATTSLQDDTYLVSDVEADCTVFVSFAINPPETALAVAGGAQETTVNTGFADTLVVRLLNDAGLPVPDVEVSIDSPGSGAGAQHPATGTTDAAGELEIPVTANSVAGSYVVSATSATVSAPATFALTNTPDLPDRLVLLQGDAQQTRVGQVFPLPLSVQLRDAWNNAIAGAEVSFESAASGPGAQLSPETVATDANGSAHSLATANAVAGTHVVTATAAGLPPLEFALENLEQDVQLAVAFAVQQPHVAYGQVFDFLVTVSNAGQDAVSGVQVEVPVPDQLDASRMQWICLMEALGHCSAGGSGGVLDADVHIPAGGSVVYLVSSIVKPGAAGDTVLLTAGADAGIAGMALADAQAILVIMRDGFDPLAGWQPLERSEQLALDLASGARLSLADVAPGDGLRTVFAAAAADAWLRVELFADRWLRLRTGGADAEQATRWLPVSAGGSAELVRTGSEACRIELWTDAGTDAIPTPCDARWSRLTAPDPELSAGE